MHHGLVALLDLGLMCAIPDREGYYADALGRIWSTHRGGRGGEGRWSEVHRIRTYLDRDGYETVILIVDGKRKRQTVHRLVALAFLGPRPPGQVCAHYNGIKTDNHPDNLVYVTSRENVVEHTARLGKRVNGENSHLSKLTEIQARQILARLQGGESQASLAREYGVGVSTIWGLKTGRTWRHLTASEANA